MFKRLIAGALFAGVSAGALAALLQLTFVVPLIHEGELYESGALTHFASAAEAHDHHAATDEASEADAGHSHDHEVAPPKEDVPLPPFDLRRTMGTFGFFLISYTGFALLMMGGFALAERAGHKVNARSGVVWGLAGFLAVQMAPAFGLPPEIPGASAAALEARQLWWVGTVLATIAGIALLAFGKGPTAIALAMVLIALPHLMGAPTAAYGGAAPPELSAHFATRVLGAGAVCWALLGTIAGFVWSRDTAA
jgi:cobalt transporter subunit CbtA